MERMLKVIDDLFYYKPKMMWLKLDPIFRTTVTKNPAAYYMYETVSIVKEIICYIQPAETYFENQANRMIKIRKCWSAICNCFELI